MIVNFYLYLFTEHCLYAPQLRRWNDFARRARKAVQAGTVFHTGGKQRIKKKDKGEKALLHPDISDAA
jgi:hypothetical protein